MATGSALVRHGEGNDRFAIKLRKHDRVNEDNVRTSGTNGFHRLVTMLRNELNVITAVFSICGARQRIAGATRERSSVCILAPVGDTLAN